MTEDEKKQKWFIELEKLGEDLAILKYLVSNSLLNTGSKKLYEMLEDNPVSLLQMSTLFSCVANLQFPVLQSNIKKEDWVRTCSEMKGYASLLAADYTICKIEKGEL